MLADTEFSINFTLRHSLQTFSLLGQKFSKHTLPLVRDVNSPVWQMPPKTKVIIHHSGQQFSPHSASWQGQEFLQHDQRFFFLTACSVYFKHSLAQALPSLLSADPLFDHCKLFSNFFLGKARVHWSSEQYDLFELWFRWSDGQCQQSLCWAHIVSVQWIGKQQKGPNK